MSHPVHIFTSITNNYIPKARVLVTSIKKFHPDYKFHLVLADDIPANFTKEVDQNLFDSVILAEDLMISHFKSWVFKHTLVEMCTALKGFAFNYIIEKYQAEKIFYFDPDIVVLSPLDTLVEMLGRYQILLTPHLTSPEGSERAILDNEICSLQHGVFNLGFLAVRNLESGRAFLNWWTERLRDYCYDDIAGGLFTDQRWVDLAPCFFDDIHIIREPHYNVATWNLTHRKVTGSLREGIMVDGKPLCFYHFSGFDSGAQEKMLNVYGHASPVLKALRGWYINECQRMGQKYYATLPCKYDHFDNGVAITKGHRFIYRTRKDLEDLFTNPFIIKEADNSYYHWYLKNISNQADSLEENIDYNNPEYLRSELFRVKNELNYLKISKLWRLGNLLLWPYRKIKRRK